MDMRRRDFLMGTAAIAAAGATRRLWAQSPDPNRQAKLARIAVLTLNFQSVLKSPERPSGTIDLMDIPDMFADRFGVHYVEVFCTHFQSTETSYFKAFSDRVKKAKSKINQISLGGLNIVSMSAPDPVLRQETVDLTKQWIDHAVELECPRVMVNQGTLDDDVREEAVAALKKMADYGRSRKVAVTLETRGGTTPWEVLVDAIKRAGAYANPDTGNFPTEEARHAGLRAMYPLASGSSHVHYAPERWSLPDAIKIAHEVGYNGIYAIEGSGTDPYATTQTIIDALLPLI
jgi:sugar phosphate isomerase/epimerase